MNYDEFMKEILDSNVDDWLYDDELGLYVLKSNLAISIQSDREDIEDREFYEKWVESYPDPKGYRARFFLKYFGNIIESLYTVAVDGYRMLIPYPKTRTELTISTKQYTIGKIVNIPYNGHDFDDYLQRANIKIDQ